MNVIFLDFNGVLDTYYKMNEINYDNLQRLKFLATETNAKIVISSSLKNSYWRSGRISANLMKILDRLISEGLDVIGFTPMRNNREEEIKDYLKEHKDIENYVILDDDYDFSSMEEHMVKLPCQNSSESLGLTEEYTKKAISILKKN